MNKKIGIVGWNVGQNSFGVTHSYLHFFSNYGQVEIITPSKGIRTDLDLVVLPGGPDALSSKYGQVPSFMNSSPDVFKEFFLETNLKQYIDAKVPIFGICLGHQMLNIFFGGSIIQNCAHPYSEKSRDELVHPVYFTPPYSKLKTNWGFKKDEKIEVNSLHHQGIHEDDLGEGLNPILVGPYGIVEAMEHKTLPICSVQWHPEELVDVISSFMIEELLEKVPSEKLEQLS